jgi:serine phosphatase RsbU (regulator of sigma subunit)/PAS domain-containing protein
MSLETGVPKNKYKNFNSWHWFSVLAILIILFIIALNNFLLFHTMIEFWAMLVAASIFIIAWNTKKVVEESTLILLGIGYLFVCILTFFHTMTYSGIDIINVGVNEPTQLWIATRFFESILLFFLPYYSNIKLSQKQLKMIIVIMSIVTSGIIMSILIYPVFPDCLIPEQGLTPFKVYGEYVLILIMIVTIINFKQKQSLIDVQFRKMMIFAIIMSIMTELSFTLYTDVYGILNFIGHIFYLISFLLVYYAVVHRGLKEPYSFIFKKLNQRTEKLLETKSFLEEVLESLSHPFYVINADNYEVEIANSAASKIAPGDTKTCYQMTHRKNHPCNSENHICPLVEVRKTGQSVVTEHIHKDQEGNDSFFEVHGYPIFNGSGKMKHMIEYSFDITQRKQTEQKLTNYTMELELKSVELENSKQRLDQEIEKARKIHEKTLPVITPEFQSIEMYAYYQPAADLGGDFYNFVKLGDELIFYISDITGHGLDAAMMNSFVKNTISTYIDLIPEGDKVDPRQILNFLVNRYQQEDYPDDFFVTILLGVIDPEKYSLRYSSAGMHVPPLLVNEGEVLELPTGNMPISSVIPKENLCYENEELNFSSGTTLFFSTDGIKEQKVGENYYNEGHYDILKKNHTMSVEEISNLINKDFMSFNGKMTGDDDITYIILKIK